MNKIYVLIGPHASGKTAISNELRSLGIPYITSYTTRRQRPTEKEGVDYFFTNKQDFLSLDLVEKTTYQGDYYGITKAELLKKMQANKICFTSLDMNGYKQLNKLFNNRVEAIYIMTDYLTIVERMIKNGENNEAIKRQLEYAEKNNELENYKTATYVVKNTGNFDTIINQILAIMGILIRR